MNKKLSKAMALGLCATVLAPSAIYAKEFKDVKKTGKYAWVYSIVDEMSNKNIINGYEDGEFKPDKHVSYEEVFQLLQGIISPSQSEVSQAVAKYGTVCDQSGVNTWAKSAISVALSRGIISESDLRAASSRSYFSATNKKYPTRNEIAIFFGKGLNLSPNGDQSLLRHGDLSSIPADVRGYLASLVKAGVFAATGSDGKFFGDQPIKRSEMAAITKFSYDYVARNPLVGKEEKLTGKVILASQLNNTNILIVEKDSKKYSFEINSATTYKSSDGKVLSFKDLQQGQEVEVTYNKQTSGEREGIVKTIVIKNTAQDLVGYVTSSTASTLTLRYRQNEKNLDYRTVNKISTTDTKNFDLASDVKITRYDKSINVKDIQTDDLVEFKTDAQGKISEATVYPKSGTVTGRVVTLRDNTTDGYVTLRLSDNKDYTFYITRDSKNTRELTSRDDVTLNVTYKVVTDVNQVSGEGIQGEVIRYESYSNDPFHRYEYGYIRIRNRRGMTEEYKVDNYTTFYTKSGVRNSQFSARDIEGKYVKLDVRNGIVQSIQEYNQADNFVATAQVISIGTNGFASNPTVGYTFRILQSNNRNLSPGKEFTIDRYTNLRFNLYDVVDLRGTVNNDSLDVNTPTLRGSNPGTILRPDTQIRDERNFGDIRDLGYDRNYSGGNISATLRN